MDRENYCLCGRVVIWCLRASFFVAGESATFDRTGIIREHLLGPPGSQSAYDLLGKWQGSWGYNGGDCTLQITRVEGDAFYGSLSKDGAEILFEGTFDPISRNLFFKETKVVRLGAEMVEWSLGENRGDISLDGRTMYGAGVDEWGQYAWAVSSRP